MPVGETKIGAWLRPSYGWRRARVLFVTASRGAQLCRVYDVRSGRTEWVSSVYEEARPV